MDFQVIGMYSSLDYMRALYKIITPSVVEKEDAI
jgi:hypothetical protein